MYFTYYFVIYNFMQIKALKYKHALYLVRAMRYAELQMNTCRDGKKPSLPNRKIKMWFLYLIKLLAFIQHSHEMG